MKKILHKILAIVFLSPIWTVAEVIQVPYNARTVVDVEDGDTLSLENFPQGWSYSRVVLGVNSSPSLQLSGYLKVNGCKHRLDSYYRQVSFELTGSTLIRFSGESQRLPIQWWVDNGSDYSPCEPVENSADSIKKAKIDWVDSVIAEREADYINLDTLNGNYAFSGTEAFFRISNLPDFDHNAIYIQIEPLDGRELDGGFYTGLEEVHLSGWTETVVVQRRTRYSPSFELAFPCSRTVRLKWWVGTEDLSWADVTANETALSADSVRLSYARGSVTYDRRLFVDRQVPQIKVSRILPTNISALYETGDLVGSVYDIKANNIPGTVISVAIPLTFKYHRGRDSVYFAHFLESESRWEKIAVDSIVDNVAYFRASSFSWYSDIWSGIEDGLDVTLDIFDWLEDKKTSIVKVIVNGAATTVVRLTDGLVGMYKSFVSVMCGDWSPLKSAIDGFFPNDWSLGQGSVPLFDTNAVSLGNTTLVEKIKNLANGDLQRIDTINDYSDKWGTTSSNLDVVLADLIYSRLNPDYSRRFSFYMSDDFGKTFIRDATRGGGQANLFTDYFQTEDVLIEDAMYLVKLVESLYGSTNIEASLFYEMCTAWGNVQSGNVSTACKEWLSGYGLIDRANDLVDLGAYLAEYTHDFMLSNSLPKDVSQNIMQAISGTIDFNPFSDLQSEKDDWLQKMTSTMLRISLLAWLDKSEFRPLSLINYVKAYNGIMTWLQLASPVYGYNNISIKANAALALFEFIHYGTENNLKDMDKGLNRNYGENGGFSEGMGYSQYIWDDVSYAIAVLQEAYRQKNKTLNIEAKFLKSAEYVLEMSRPVKDIGLVSVEVDDGCTYNPDYLVWGKIYSNLGDWNLSSRFGAFAKKYPLLDATKMLPMMVLGLPSMWNGKYDRLPSFINGQNYTYWKQSQEANDFWRAYGNPDSVLNDGRKLWGSFKDGVGLITAVSADSDTVALSIIAENGDLWKNGQAHDQQDNLSITLSSSKKGFLIQDRGYKGFDERWDESVDVTRHYSHNRIVIQGDGSYCASLGIDSLCIDKSTELGNRLVGESEIIQKARDFSNSDVGAIWRTIPDKLIHVLHFLGKDMDDFRTYGGTEADTLEFVNNASEKEIFIVSKNSSQRVNNRDSIIIDIRTIMYYGGGFWVIDRPSVKGLMWLVNSPLESWDTLTLEGVKLYGLGMASLAPKYNSWTDSLCIQQEGVRGDYPEKVLNLKQFALQDSNALTYVMTYGVDGFDMKRTERNCLGQYQCFENPEGSKRIVVAPYGHEITVGSVVENVKVQATTNGILLANYNDGYWELRPIGGNITAPGGGQTKNLFVSGNKYHYTDLNGNYHADSTRGAYLPHIPLLLLR